MWLNLLMSVKARITCFVMSTNRGGSSVGQRGLEPPLPPCIAWSPPKSPQYFLAMDEVEEEGKEEEEEEKERKEEEEGEISAPPPMLNSWIRHFLRTW